MYDGQGYILSSIQKTTSHGTSRWLKPTIPHHTAYISEDMV